MASRKSTTARKAAPRATRRNLPQAARDRHSQAILGLVRARAAAAVVADASHANARIIIIECILGPISEALEKLDPAGAVGFESACLATLHPQTSLAREINRLQGIAAARKAHP